MTVTCGDLVSVGLGGGGWDQKEVRWVEKGGRVCRKLRGRGDEEEECVGWGAPGQMVLPLAQMGSKKGRSG